MTKVMKTSKTDQDPENTSTEAMQWAQVGRKSFLVEDDSSLPMQENSSIKYYTMCVLR